MSENFNVSLPWIQVKGIRVRDSKYGVALVLETSESSGGYVLGFKVEALEKVFTEITQLFETYSQQPFFGVDCVFEEAEKNIDEVTIPREEDTIDIVETGYEQQITAQRQRYEIGKKSKMQDEGNEIDIALSEELGLACEKLPDSITLEQLWRIA